MPLVSLLASIIQTMLVATEKKALLFATKLFLSPLVANSSVSSSSSSFFSRQDFKGGKLGGGSITYRNATGVESVAFRS